MTNLCLGPSHPALTHPSGPTTLPSTVGVTGAGRSPEVDLKTSAADCCFMVEANTMSHLLAESGRQPDWQPN